MDQTWWYLAALIGSLVGMVLLDHRHKLVFFSHPKASAITIAIGVVFFAIVDLIGITLGIFFRGDSPYLSGITVAPEFPIEELFFLTLLCYTILAAYSAFESRGRRAQ